MLVRPDRELGVGLMGLGVVGGGVAEALLDPIRPLRSVAASGLKLKKILKLLFNRFI